jgi:hypothetical protein
MNEVDDRLWVSWRMLDDVSRSVTGSDRSTRELTGGFVVESVELAAGFGDLWDPLCALQPVLRWRRSAWICYRWLIAREWRRPSRKGVHVVVRRHCDDSMKPTLAGSDTII